MMEQNTLSELPMRAAAVLIACCWSGLELAVRRGVAAAAHWQSGTVAGGERRVETLPLAKDFIMQRAERLNVRSHVSQNPPQSNRVPEDS